MSARKRNAFWGFSADIGGMLVVQLLSLALIPFYLKYISLAAYGYWLVILSIIGWLGLADFGIGFAVTRFFVKAMSSGQDDKDGVDKVANTSLLLFLAIAAFFLALGIGLMPLLGKWFHIGQANAHIFFTAFLIAVAATCLVIPFALFSGLLEAKQKIALNRTIQTVGLVVQFVSSIFFVLAYKNIIGLALGLLLGNMVSSLLLVIYVRKQKLVTFSRKLVSKQLLKQLFSFGGYFQLGKTANIIATNTDSLFIASFLDPAKVPVYSFTSRLPLLFCNTIASKIPAALFSGLSELFDKADFALFKATFSKLTAIIFRIAFFAAITIFFINQQFVTVWVGSENFGGFYLNLVFVYWVFFETVIRGTGLVIQIFGEMKIWALAAIVESLLNIGLSFYFLYTGWGILGLALATAIARTLTIGVYWVRFLAQKNLFSFGELASLFMQNFLRNLPVFIVLYILAARLNTNKTILELILYPAIALLVNVFCYDWIILKKALQAGSLRTLYNGYKQKYW